MNAADGGCLYLCATPIGNLEDVTARVLRVLREADLVAAEDTRRTRQLLTHFGISRPLVSYHRHNEARRSAELVARMQAGATVALVSDAGTPGISDPGERLVRAAVAAGIPVVPLPGPSSLLAALTASGLPAARFAFEGFLPRKGPERRRRLAELAREPRTMVLYEAPARVSQTLADLAAALGEDRPAAVARELTKVHEEVRRGGLGELARWARRGPVRGEIVLVVQGAPPRPAPAAQADSADLQDAVRACMRAGLDKKAAIQKVAQDRELPRRLVYRAVMELPASGGADPPGPP